VIARVLLLCALAVGCTGAPQPSQPSVEGVDKKSGDTLFVSISLDPDNINPIVAPYAVSGWLTDLVSPGLVRRAVNDDGLYFEPSLAESWLFSEDGLQLTYTLREGLLWEDGAPLVADDVVFTSQLIADEKVGSNWFGDSLNVANVEALDARTVRYTFKEARNSVLQQGYTMRGILPKHVFEGIPRGSLRSHETSRRPVASGPFRVDRWDSNERIILRPNPNAPADWKPNLNAIVFVVQPESTTRKMSLLKGEVDLEADVEFPDVAEVIDSPNLDVLTLKAEGMMYLGYNLTKPRYQDVRLRRALTMAVDREKIIQTQYTHDGVTYAQPCVGTIAPTLGAWYAKDLEPLPFDPAGAERLLTEAGWVDTDKDGIRDKDGEPLRIIVMLQNGSVTSRDALLMVQAHWKRVGVAMDIDGMDTTTFADRARAKKFDAMLWGFGANPKIDLSIKWGTGERYNWYSYSNPKVDELIAKANRSLDITEAQAAVREAQRIIHEDQAVTFMLWQDTVIARSKRFQDADQTTFTPLFHAEKWWVPAGQRKY
jgi:peptide/nickel transport system substrate-binding protein